MRLKDKIARFFMTKEQKYLRDSLLRARQQSLDKLMKEYDLICEKKSNLTVAQRRVVLNRVDQLVKKGVLSYKK